MRWLSFSAALLLGTLAGVTGCGSGPGAESGGSSRLTMEFVEFNGDGITQEDDVGPNSAQVDVCKTLCQIGILFQDIVFEQYTQTTINAVFMNNGQAPILLDSYTVDIEGSGVDPITRSLGALLPGGQCSDTGASCATDRDCISVSMTGTTAFCEHQETTIGNILLFDFGTKDVVTTGRCPVCDTQTGQCTAGTKVPETFNVNLTFSGTDTTNERFTISAGYVATFFDANNCMATTGA